MVSRLQTGKKYNCFPDMFSLNVGIRVERENAEDKLRLVLIGPTGSGKSASGNTILGRRQFLSELKASSVTQVCEQGSVWIPVEWQEKDFCRRKHVVVVDTPGFEDTHSDPNQVYSEIAKCVTLSSPGPHAFLLVIQLGRYTEDEDKAAREMLQIFGESALQRHTVLVITHGDDLEETAGDMESFLGQDAPEPLRSLMEDCGGRYHVLNNNQSENRKQVRELLRKVEKMVEENGGQCYTSPVFQEAEIVIQERGKKKCASSIRLFCRGAALSPNYLGKVKVLVAAAATGLAVGAICGTVAPLVFAAGASVMGTSVSHASDIAGKTALVVGAAIGGVIGGVNGLPEGAEAAESREAALETLKQVALMGAAVLGVAFVVGAAPTGAKVFGIIDANGVATTGQGSSGVKELEKTVAGLPLPGGFAVTVVKEKVQTITGYTVKKSLKVNWKK